MSLKDAILGVVTDMLAEVEDLKDEQSASYTRSSLKGYARTLKAICEAAGEPPLQPSPTPIGSFPFLGGMMSADLQHHMAVEAARSEFRGKSKPGARVEGRIEEQHEGEGVLCVGGPASDTFTTINPNMPYGALTEVAGGMYQLTFDKEQQVKRMIFHEKKTEELQLLVRSRKSGD